MYVCIFVAVFSKTVCVCVCARACVCVCVCVCECVCDRERGAVKETCCVARMYVRLYLTFNGVCRAYLRYTMENGNTEVIPGTNTRGTRY